MDVHSNFTQTAHVGIIEDCNSPRRSWWSLGFSFLLPLWAGGILCVVIFKNRNSVLLSYPCMALVISVCFPLFRLKILGNVCRAVCCHWLLVAGYTFNFSASSQWRQQDRPLLLPVCCPSSPVGVSEDGFYYVRCHQSYGCFSMMELWGQIGIDVGSYFPPIQLLGIVM